MIASDRERQAPTTIKEAEPSHLARYQFAQKFTHTGDVVLDIPCGSGYGAGLLSSGVESVVAIDIHSGAIQHAKEFFQFPNTEFLVGDMENIGESVSMDKQFDLVVSFEGIEHIVNQRGFLKDIKKILKPGGRLIISTPRKPHGSPYHTIEFSLLEFKEILSEHFFIEKMFGQIYTDIFDMEERQEDPHAYTRFNFIAVCRNLNE